MCVCVCVCTNMVDIWVEVAPLEDDEEHQPAKDAHQKQQLRNELQEYVGVLLEVAVEGREGGREGGRRRKGRSAHLLLQWAVIPTGEHLGIKGKQLTSSWTSVLA